MYYADIIAATIIIAKARMQIFKEEGITTHAGDILYHANIYLMKQAEYELCGE